MLDLAVTGGTVVTESGAWQLDIGASDGKTVALGAPGSLSGAKRTVDATGLVVLPGGVDPHVHTNPPYGMPNVLGRDVITKAALYGGMTTMLDFVWPGENSPSAALEEAVEAWRGDSYTDYGFHIVLSDLMPAAAISEIPTLIRNGFPSFKIFTTRVTPSLPSGFKISTGPLSEIMRTVGAHGGIVTVHAEDDELVMHEYEQHLTAGKTDLVHMPDVHTTLSEELSFHHTLRLAAHYRTATYFHHVTAQAGVDALREFRARGLPTYGETLAVLTLATADRYADPDGVKYHIYPSLRFSPDVEALWSGIADGTIHSFGTDGVCCLWEDKNRSRTIDGAWGGVTGVEPKLALLYTEMVQNRGLSLNELANQTATNSSKIFGLYPKKGVIAVGSDADYVVIDPHTSKVVDAAQLHEGDYTPWGGRTLSGWPTHTIKAGDILVDSGTLTVDERRGQLVHRTIDGAILEGPALGGR